MPYEIPADAEIKFLGDVQRLALKPGDMLVLSTDEILSLEQMTRLKHEVDTVLPCVKVLVLSGGLKLGVIECPVP